MIYAPAPWLRMSLRSFVIINSAYRRQRFPTTIKIRASLIIWLNARRGTALIVSCNWRMLSWGTFANSISLKDRCTCALRTSQRTCYVPAPSGCMSYIVVPRVTRHFSWKYLVCSINFASNFGSIFFKKFGDKFLLHGNLIKRRFISQRLKFLHYW